MAPRGLLIIAALAIAGGIAWFALRDRGGETPRDPVHAAATNPETPALATPPSPTPAIAQHAPDRPALPDLLHGQLPDGGIPTLAQLYAAEPRDADWGPRTEKEIEHQLAHLTGGTLDNTECHLSQCELTLSSTDEGGMQHAIGELEAKRGLAGIAQSMMLTAPDRHADGSLVLHVFASFVR